MKKLTVVVAAAFSMVAVSSLTPASARSYMPCFEGCCHHINDDGSDYYEGTCQYHNCVNDTCTVR
ncbi:MAG TPA: hypothetical protein VGJ20_43450 [Xanthobacteraceae bacterium]|jgi:hypothetical protein